MRRKTQSYGSKPLLEKSKRNLGLLTPGLQPTTHFPHLSLIHVDQAAIPLAVGSPASLRDSQTTRELVRSTLKTYSSRKSTAQWISEHLSLRLTEDH